MAVEGDYAMRNNEEVKRIRETYRRGMRIRLLSMDDPQAPPVGCEGTVLGVDDIGDVMVAWETGSGLKVIQGEDEIEIISGGEDR